MDVTEGLTLLAEGSWGVTRKILYQAKDIINAQRQTLLQAGELVDLLDREDDVSLTAEELERVAELSAILKAEAEAVAELLDGLEGTSD